MVQLMLPLRRQYFYEANTILMDQIGVTVLMLRFFEVIKYLV
jgi:hypothetical protein